MRGTAIVLVVAFVLTAAAGAQRASRPADDWTATLEAPDRVAGLKIPEVVAAMKLRPGDVVADLGAGSGLFVERAIGLFPGIWAESMALRLTALS